MKNSLKLFLVIILFTLSVRSQESSRLKVIKNYITLMKPFDSSSPPLVYKGELSENELPDATPILGKTISNKESVRFTPLIPFSLGQKYTVLYGNILDYFEISIPEDYKHLSVEEIYPSAKKVPSNLLKWHVRFLKPINLANVYNHIYFTNTSGDTLQRAILPLENALISEGGQLLTVWIDPGRQKRGLIPNQQLGAVFEEGKDYSMIIPEKLKDQEGIPMKQDLVYKFTIAKADRERPNINLWKINIPDLDTTLELRIDFYESMDYVSALSSITIVNSKKEEVVGTMKLVNNESTLVFEPQQSWTKGEYHILIDSRVEDLAGNSLNRLFDSEIIDTIPSNSNEVFQSLTFEIKETP